jgi:hypothetical protein
MTVLAEGLDALDLCGRTVAEVVRITDADDSLEAVQVVFSDGQSLVLTVWTDWRLMAQLRSDAVVPEYLWPVESRTRAAIGGFVEAGKTVSEITPRLNEAGMLVEVRIVVADRPVLVKSFGGDLVVEAG